MLFVLPWPQEPSCDIPDSTCSMQLIPIAGLFKFHREPDSTGGHVGPWNRRTALVERCGPPWKPRRALDLS